MLGRFIYLVRTRFLSQEYGQSTVEFAGMLTVVAILILVLTGMTNEIRELLGGIGHLIGTL